MRERIDPLQHCLAGLKGRTWRISFWELHIVSTSFSGSLIPMASIARHHAVWGRESLISQTIFIHAILGLQQDRRTLLNSFCRFGAKASVIIVTDRVRNHRKRKLRHARNLCHDLSCLHKPIRDDGRSRDPRLLGRDGVVQTARRATPSIADGGDDGLTALQVGHDLWGRRPARIGLSKP